MATCWCGKEHARNSILCPECAGFHADAHLWATNMDEEADEDEGNQS